MMTLTDDRENSFNIHHLSMVIIDQVCKTFNAAKIQAIKHFFRVYIASSKHEEGWEKTKTWSRVFLTLDNSPNPTSVEAM